MTLSRPKPGSDVLAARVQARLEAIESSPAAPPTRRAAPPAAVVEPVHEEGSLEDLHQQLAVLREQLEAAFAEVEDRLTLADARAEDAVSRAERAEGRAAAADARFGDLLGAVDDVRRTFARALASPEEHGNRGRLQEALDRLRDRVNASAR